MAGQDRGDGVEPTSHAGAQDGPDAAPTAALPGDPAGGTPPDQPVDADRESADAAAGTPAPGSPPGPPPAGPGAPSAGPRQPAAGPSGTSVLPPVAGGPPPEPPRWAARAQVPTPRVEDYPEEWVAAEPPRGLLVPVLVTVCTMLLVGFLGVGAWILVSNRPQPGPSAPLASTTTEPTTTTTTRTPVTTTTSATPAGIQVPPLTGEEYEDAARVLAELGLEPEREDVVSDAVPAGHVVGTSPTAGTRVSPGDTIIVFVARGAETAEPTATPTGTPTATATAP